ncbi:MAG: DUF4190 domain-containing protein [Phycisphaerae bacterium]|nr:DUF4190 domain-containing protein [Tepidisphaeraceae bacterium]
MSQYPAIPVPPPFNPAYAPAGPRPSNGPAVTSLVCGIAGIIPFVPSLLALVFGMVGLNRAKQLGGTGRGMAVSGLVLGILGLVLWTWGFTAFFSSAKQYKQLSHTFVTALAQGDVDKAVGMSHSKMTRDQIAQPAAALQTLGALGDITVTDVKSEVSTEAGKRWTVTGDSTFATRKLNFTITFVDENGSPKVVEYWFK